MRFSSNLKRGIFGTITEGGDIGSRTELHFILYSFSRRDTLNLSATKVQDQGGIQRGLDKGSWNVTLGSFLDEFRVIEHVYNFTTY